MTTKARDGGQPTACFPGDLTREELTMATELKREEKRSDTVPLDWKEVYYTNCPLVSASNVDQELGWTKEEYKKIGVKYAFLRSTAREQLVPALHPQPRQPDPLRRSVPADPRPRRHPPDRAAGRDARPPRGRLHDGARAGRHLPDEGTERQEDRPLEEPEHHQERLVAHPGAPGHRADAPDERHDHGRRRDRRVPLRRTTGTTTPRCWTRWRTRRSCG